MSIMRLGCFPTAAAIAAALLTSFFTAGARQPVPNDPDAVYGRLGLARGTLVTLDVDTTPTKSLSVSIPLYAERWTLDLQPYSVRGENFRLFERREGGQLFELKP